MQRVALLSFDRNARSLRREPTGKPIAENCPPSTPALSRPYSRPPWPTHTFTHVGASVMDTFGG
jgi:hypothetical protein